jgi:cysteinyl-tRNA synthetase
MAIMVSDIVSDNADMSDAVTLCEGKGFLAFPRSSDNTDYKVIPALSTTNTANINTLADAKNYLYLISDAGYTDKAAMISAIKQTNYDVVLIDLFFQGETFSTTDIASLKQKSGGGTRLVLAYISIGSAEKYRNYWQAGWKKGSPSWIKKNYAGYPDEYWVEYWNTEWRNIIFDYIDQIIDAGFDGVCLDNVEAYYFVGR